MNLYPRSFLRLILSGWLLTALPLLIAIAFASLSLTELTARSAAAMRETAEATRLAWEVDEDIISMERLLRQFDALQDVSLIDDYLLAQQEWQKHLDELAHLPLLVSLND